MFVKLISIEGNIGAGKSTMIDILRKKYQNNPQLFFMQEPVDLWTDVKNKNGNTILTEFYANPTKYAFCFQVMAFTTRMQKLQEVLDFAKQSGCESPIIIMERSLDADKEIFAKMLRDSLTMDDLEYQVYEMYSKTTLEKYAVDSIVWLKTTTDECARRIITRGREGELIDREYLDGCDQYHQKWLGDHPSVFPIADNCGYNEDALDQFLFTPCK